MAIIYSYPEKITPADGDFLVITDSEQTAPNKNRTKSLKIENLADYIVSSTSGITGSGTLNTIAMFTPNGQAIGDSRMVEIGYAIQVGTPTLGQATLLGDDFISTKAIGTTQLTVDNISAQQGGNVILIGNVIIGDQNTDILQITSSVSDYTGTASTAAGQVLVSNASSQLEWKSYSESGATFLGWARYDGTPSFSNGTEVTVLDGNYIDPPVSLVTNQVIDPYTNGASGKFVFTSNDLNAVYSLTVVFKASAANANQTHIDINFVSGATDYERLSKSIGFYKGNDVVDNFHEMFQFYVDSDLITYGLQPRLYAQGGDVKFGDVIFFIQKQQQPAI